MPLIYPALLLTGGAAGIWVSKGLSTLNWLVLTLLALFTVTQLMKGRV